MIDNITIPIRWKHEGVSTPNKTCKSLTKKVVDSLFLSYSLEPERIAVSMEGGILVNYINYKNENNLSIEIYNDLDIAAIVTKSKKTIKVMDVINEDFEEIIKAFKKQWMMWETTIREARRNEEDESTKDSC
ncbi:MAG: hypothetical protein GY679_01880 [Mycoplasma sp.]|nr:hypothetical protein [Mycoplasma sp.]